jgi:hypothetical protein
VRHDKTFQWFLRRTTGPGRKPRQKARASSIESVTAANIMPRNAVGRIPNRATRNRPKIRPFTITPPPESGPAAQSIQRTGRKRRRKAGTGLAPVRSCSQPREDRGEGPGREPETALKRRKLILTTGPTASLRLSVRDRPIPVDSGRETSRRRQLSRYREHRTQRQAMFLRARPESHRRLGGVGYRTELPDGHYSSPKSNASFKA